MGSCNNVYTRQNQQKLFFSSKEAESSRWPKFANSINYFSPNIPQFFFENNISSTKTFIFQLLKLYMPCTNLLSITLIILGLLFLSPARRHSGKPTCSGSLMIAPVNLCISRTFWPPLPIIRPT